MRSLVQALGLALSDYRHEALFSACSVFVLAAVLAPLMVLLGVRNGVISAMTDRLLRDPRTLEIIPVGSGKYSPEWFRELAARPETAFVVPQTRSIAATISLTNPNRPNLGLNVTRIVATAPGDPLLERYGLPEAGFVRDEKSADPLYPAPLVIVSASVARKLAVPASPQELKDPAGYWLEGRVERVLQGRREAAGINLRVAAVLPPEALGVDAVFVPLEALAAAEDYRDGKNAPLFRALAAPRAEKRSEKAVTPENFEDYSASLYREREYASFRLYARSLDAVEPLWKWLAAREVEVYVKVEEIEAVKSLDHAFSVIFGLITGAALFGFAASTAGNALAGVRRKSRSLGLMRLLGFPGAGIVLFPVVQSLLTAFSGAMLADLLYLIVAFAIDSLFSASLPGKAAVCSLSPGQTLAVFAAVLAVSALSSVAAARQAADIEPSEVLRDV
jgi:putative ABC transport system permease protein